MISALIYSHERRELSAISRLGREIICKISEDDWDFFSFSDKKDVYDFLSADPIIDMSCVDIFDTNGISIAERLRETNNNMYIILLTDASISPVLYIRPTIMAGSLLMRPLTEKSVKRVFTEAVRECLKKFRKDDGEAFAIENRDGRQLIPYSRIIFFESREKKIFVNTGSREYSFYDTLDNLEKNLPKGFIRCHRSYIIARKNIKKIILSQNTIILDNECEVPLSRSYKSVFKELK